MIRKNAEGQSASVREIAEIEAKDAIQKAQPQADSLIKNSERQIAESQSRFENQQRRLSKFKRTSESYREGQVEQLGERILPTELGQQTRTLYDKALETIKTNREAATQKLRETWKNIVQTIPFAPLAKMLRGLNYVSFWERRKTIFLQLLKL